MPPRSHTSLAAPSDEGANPIERLRRATPILEFVLLAFLIAYTVGFGLLWLCRSFTGTWSQYLPRVGVVYAPAIAALLVTGRSGASALLRKLNPRGQWLWVPGLLATGVVSPAQRKLYGAPEINLPCSMYRTP